MKQFILFLFFFTSSLVLADTQTITLKDGSQVKGELVGIDNGTYTIKTPSMGSVQVKGSQVANISAEGAVMPAQNTPQVQAPRLPASDDMSQKMQAMQTQLMSNPSYMAEIQQMLQDPEIVKIMSDPDFIQAITAKDVNAIKNNPRTQELMNNPKMRAFIEKVQGVSQAPSAPVSDNSVQ